MTTFRGTTQPTNPPDHLLTLKEAEEKLQHFKRLLEECIQHGWDAWKEDYKHKHHLLRPRTRASIVFDEIVDYAEKLFAGMDGVTFRRMNNSFLLYIGNDIVIRFKKIKKDGRCSSIQTHQQYLFKAQMELPWVEKGTMLHAGYALDDLQLDITRKLVVCQFENRVLWTIDLTSKDETGAEPMPTPAPEPQKGPRWEISPEEQKKEEKKEKSVAKGSAPRKE